jgi:sigma-B regulation protein RsbU (phosphoserine phosphatase)
VELLARIRYHSRGYIALLERHEAYTALQRSEAALRDQLDSAADYVRSLLPRPITQPVRIDWRFIPSAALGGDAFDYQWLDDQHLAMCLLDVCGHGVGPALLSVSVLNTLRSRTLPDTNFLDPSSVLASLNKAFQMDRQNDLFFTMWYAVYDLEHQSLTHAGGAHPPALLKSGINSSQPIQRLESRGPIVGIEDDGDFPSQSCTVQQGDHLYFFSDGVFEIVKADGHVWTIDEFIQFLDQQLNEQLDEQIPRIEKILTHVQQLQGHAELNDDFSIVHLQF